MAGLIAVTIGFALALWPEPQAKRLTAPDWVKAQTIGVVSLPATSRQNRYVRDSILADKDAVILRTFTPERGVQPGSLESPEFVSGGPFVVPVTGNANPESGKNAAFVECTTHPHRIAIFRGSVNVNFSEAMVSLPPKWCAGRLKLRLEAQDESNVGIGAPYEIAAVSSWKASFLGLLPYLILSWLIFAAVFLASALVGRVGLGLQSPVIGGFAGFGLVSLLAFYSSAIVEFRHAGALLLLVVLLPGIWVIMRRPQTAREVLQLSAPYATVWAVAALGYFALLMAGQNGLGSWEPNGRFAPASWSSDNELPSMIAMAIRENWSLDTLFGSAGWKPTDRPPLMSGALTLVVDSLQLLQVNNDGDYLRGLAFDVAQISLNSLWIVAGLLFLTAGFRLDRAKALLVLTASAFLPVVIFNTIYGWPKLFGAAFAAAAATLVLVTALERRRPTTSQAVLFGVLCASSLLCHMSNAPFLLALSLAFVVTGLWKAPHSLLAGAAAGLSVLLTWTAYQAAVLPTNDPLLRYALSGDFGFGKPEISVAAQVLSRYASLSLSEWLSIKWNMLVMPFGLALSGPMQMGVSPDYESGFAGLLRKWDLLFLSAGNVLPFAALGFFPFRSALRRKLPHLFCAGQTVDEATRLMLITVLSAFGLTVCLFLMPTVVPTLPFGLILTAALSGLAWLMVAAPSSFQWVTFALVTYTGLVWVLGPLKQVLSTDIGAMIVVIAATVSSVIILLRKGESDGTSRPAMLGE